MERMNCQCRRCGSVLGELWNLWNQAGKSYFSPIIPPEESLKVVLEGAVRVGEPGTLVSKCQLQDIACSNCRGLMGLQCLSAPTNHILEKLVTTSTHGPLNHSQDEEKQERMKEGGTSQVLLRSDSFVALNTESARQIELRVKRVLRLRESSRGATRSRSGGSPLTGSPESNSSAEQGKHVRSGPETHAPNLDDLAGISLIQAEIEVQRDDIDRLDSAGLQIVTAINEAVGRIENELSCLRDVIHDVKCAQGANQNDVTSLKDEVEGFKRLISAASASDRCDAHIQTTESMLSEMRQDLNSATSQIRHEVALSKADSQQTKERLESTVELFSTSAMATGEHDSIVRSLQSELSQLERQFNQHLLNAPDTKNAVLPSRELEILTANIAKVGSRASQVEMLQMELDIIKERLGRLESLASNTVATRGQGHAQQPQTSGLLGGAMIDDADRLSVEGERSVPNSDFPSFPQPSKRRAPLRGSAALVSYEQDVASDSLETSPLSAPTVGPKKFRRTRQTELAKSESSSTRSQGRRRAAGN